MKNSENVYVKNGEGAKVPKLNSFGVNRQVRSLKFGGPSILRAKRSRWGRESNVLKVKSFGEQSSLLGAKRSEGEISMWLEERNVPRAKRQSGEGETSFYLRNLTDNRELLTHNGLS